MRAVTPAPRRLRIALWVGAALWLFLVLAGFFAPGGWTWGMPGPVGHMENYVISLWIVVLVLTPWVVAAIALGLLVWAHPRRAR